MLYSGIASHGSSLLLRFLKYSESHISGMKPGVHKVARLADGIPIPKNTTSAAMLQAISYT